MDTDGFSVREAAQRLQRRQAARESELAARRARAQRWAREVAGAMATIDASIVTIVGFGSTFEAWRNYREDSDIDIGIIGGDWSRLAGSIPHGEFKVALVELDLQNAEFRDHALKHGEVLYEKR